MPTGTSAGTMNIVSNRVTRATSSGKPGEYVSSQLDPPDSAWGSQVLQRDECC